MTKLICPKCGNTEFYAHQAVRMDVVVDGDNGFLRNASGDDASASIYDAEKPYGPYTCPKCGHGFDPVP